jgi:two-component system LytT family response regulator
MKPLRVVIADDEPPARRFLSKLLESIADVSLVGEAETGAEAIQLIERERPDLAFLDLQMPEIDGLGVARLLDKTYIPLIAFVTAYDEYAVRAFELNAVDYLLKPVEPGRLEETIKRARDRLGQPNWRGEAEEHLNAAVADYESTTRPKYLERIPIRRRDEILLIPVNQIASIVAEGEHLKITTQHNDCHTITYRLKELEGRLDPTQFKRLARGTLANIEMMVRVNVMPGGTYLVTLSNGQELPVSRQQSRILRDDLIRL